MSSFSAGIRYSHYQRTLYHSFIGSTTFFLFVVNAGCKTFLDKFKIFRQFYASNADLLLCKGISPYEYWRISQNLMRHVNLIYQSVNNFPCLQMLLLRNLTYSVPRILEKSFVAWSVRKISPCRNFGACLQHTFTPSFRMEINSYTSEWVPYLVCCLQKLIVSHLCLCQIYKVICIFLWLALFFSTENLELV